MLLQTNSYIVAHNQRAEHVRLMRQFRVCFRRLGADFEVFEEAGHDAHGNAHGSARFVQLMRFRDRGHYKQVTEAEKVDPAAQKLIAAFCNLVDLPHQADTKLFRHSLLTDCLPCNDTSEIEGSLAGSTNGHDHPKSEADSADKRVSPGATAVEAQDCEDLAEPPRESPDRPEAKARVDLPAASPSMA